MLNEDELILVLALQNTPGIGDIRARRLLKFFGSPTALYEEKSSNLKKIEGIGSIRAESLFKPRQLKEAEAEIRFMEKNGIGYSYFEDHSYPFQLKHCIDGPIVLFEKGRIQFDGRPVISIVGTRQITNYGREFCRSMIEKLAIYNPIIVSGFAYGTDITAQISALENNLQTIGCLAHGFNRLYPSVHKKYVQPILEKGGFFTDFRSTDDFIRNNFLKRNRIIAGLSEATIVIESAAKGGSLVTADIAISYNREVFAVPGKPEDLYSEGCNNLIKQQRAHLLSKPEDIPYILGWTADKEPAITQTDLFEQLNDRELSIYNQISDKGKQHLDEIAHSTQIPISELVVVLLEMEMKGRIRPSAGKFFEAI